jgi:chorismate dehydratase
MDSPETIRVGAVSYLNTRPLVFGLERGVGGGRFLLTYDVPATLADRMAREELDLALLPSIELARLPELEVVPGIGIGSRGPAGSVLLIAKRPLTEVRRVALDPESRTSNALVRVLFGGVWKTDPVFTTGRGDLPAMLRDHDAAIRIGDKALFETPPERSTVVDLGEAWTTAYRLPFVYAVWVARPGVLDRDVYRALHDSRREGTRALEAIAEDYTWNGRQFPEISLRYLRQQIRYRLGSSELNGLKTFLDEARRAGIIRKTPEIKMGLARWTDCHETAAERGV